MTIAPLEYTRVASTFVFSRSTQTQVQIGVTGYTEPDLSGLTAREQLVQLNLVCRGPESEDALLIADDLLPRLIASARQVPPSEDWERDLYAL